MQLFPTSEQLRQRLEQIKVGVAILLAAALVSLMAYLYFGFIPETVDGLVRHSRLLDQHDIAWKQFYDIEKAVRSAYQDQNENMLNQSLDFGRNGYDYKELKNLAKLPQVLDAFWYNNDIDTLITANGIVQRDELEALLRSPDRTPPFEEVKSSRVLPANCHTDLNENLLLTYAEVRKPGVSKPFGRLGLAFDYNSFLDSIAGVLDKAIPMRSAAIEEMLGGYGKSMGLLHGKDTIWWRGDKTEPVIDHDWDSKSWRHTGVVYLLTGFDLKVHSRSFSSGALDDDRHQTSFLINLIQNVAAIGFLLIITLIIMLSLLRRRHARNQIALAHLAHAVKTPVARLKLAAETLTEGRVASPEEERTMMKAVTRECDRLDRAVQNAALSLEKGRLEFNLQAGDLGEVVREVAESWLPSFENSGIELKLTLATGQSGTPVVRYDYALLPVALDNLIDNALRHTRLRMAPLTPPAIAEGESGSAGSRPCPSIEISLTSDVKHVILTIDDSGTGIPKSERNRLFKPFGSSPRDPKSGVTGLGLGLALVRRIVEGHKGTIEAGDSPAGGARFTMKLPVSQS